VLYESNQRSLTILRQIAYKCLIHIILLISPILYEFELNQKVAF